MIVVLPNRLELRTLRELRAVGFSARIHVGRRKAFIVAEPAPIQQHAEPTRPPSAPSKRRSITQQMFDWLMPEERR